MDQLNLFQDQKPQLPSWDQLNYIAQFLGFKSLRPPTKKSEIKSRHEYFFIRIMDKLHTFAVEYDNDLDSGSFTSYTTESELLPFYIACEKDYCLLTHKTFDLSKTPGGRTIDQD